MSITPEKRYEYLIGARNYHYTQFNIWMAFFLAIIGALFVAYCTLSSADEDLFAEKILVSAFGYMVSLLFHLSSKGYYYWITNWITLIMEHEERSVPFYDFDRVYSCFANKKENNNYCSPITGANISTSKIVCFLSYLFTFAFGILFLHNLEQSAFCAAFELDSAVKIILSITLIFIVNIILCLLADVSGKFSSNISKHINFNIQLKQGGTQ